MRRLLSAPYGRTIDCMYQSEHDELRMRIVLMHYVFFNYFARDAQLSEPRRAVTRGIKLYQSGML